jgi:hypothetical protein
MKQLDKFSLMMNSMTEEIWDCSSLIASLVRSDQTFWYKSILDLEEV